MVDSYVTKAKLQNNKTVLTVQLDDFKADGPVEISGEVTQNQAAQDNAAIATFYEIQNLPHPDAGGHRYLTVTADPGDTKFDAGQALIVVARVARVWVTVLGPDKPDPEYMAWTEKAAASPKPANGGSGY